MKNSAKVYITYDELDGLIESVQAATLELLNGYENHDTLDTYRTDISRYLVQLVNMLSALSDDDEPIELIVTATMYDLFTEVRHILEQSGTYSSTLDRVLESDELKQVF